MVQMLIDGVTKGGNMLFNVGPTSRGQIEPRATERLKAVGEWMKLHGRSIYGCGPSDFEAPQDTRLTQNGDRVYMHMFAWPFKHMHVPGLGKKVKYAQLLNDGSELQISKQHQTHRKVPAASEDTLILEMPTQRPDVIVPVVELFLK
ncbi:MAG: alpha-L-fucosidase, partial [Armatimonadota bacterium]